MSSNWYCMRCLFAGALLPCAAVAEPVTLEAADGVKIYGEVWRAAGERPAVILAFHQA